MKKLIVLSVAIVCFTRNGQASGSTHSPRLLLVSQRSCRGGSKPRDSGEARFRQAPAMARTKRPLGLCPISNSTKQKAVQIAAKGYGVEPHIVRLPKASQQPLGLRYALLKVGESGELSEVLPETTFHSGDKVKISLMANQPGYIYIIQQGSSGNWRPLFPAQGDLPEANRVEAGRIYEVPSGKSFQFNQQTGEERLFILLSRQVVSDLDGVIFTLRHQGRSRNNLRLPVRIK